MPAPSLSLAEKDLVTIAVIVDGNDISDSYEIMSVHVSKAANRIPSARLVVRLGGASEGFTASEAGDFSPGRKIVLKAGYASETSSIFEGIIVKHGIRNRGNSSQLILECRDAAFQMTVGRKSAYYTNLADTEIITQIVAAHGFTPEVAAISPAWPGVTQFNCTDWDFITIRAQINGWPILAEAGKLTIKAPDLRQVAALSVTYGIDVLDFQMELDARTQFSTVECASWDAETQAMITADAEPGDINALGQDTSTTLARVIGAGTVRLATSGSVAADSLQNWARAAMLKAELSKVSGKIKFQGSAAILPGQLIEVNGFGTRFDGTGYVGGVTHSIEDGNWTTEVSLGLEPEWFASKPGIAADPAAGLLPGVRGLQTGLVKQIAGDPEGAFRVLVTVPMVNPAGDGIWARLATFYASANAGIFFYPEIGDEVILGFLNEDPRDPIILGSVYSQTRSAATAPDQDNATKAIVTLGQLKIVFDDKNKICTIETPASNQLVLSDKDRSIAITDQNGNSIVLSPAGITIKSTADLALTASQNASVQAQAGMLAAKGENGVTVSGLTVALDAETQLTAHGAATAALTSNGETTVRGAMVMIN